MSLHTNTRSEEETHLKALTAAADISRIFQVLQDRTRATLVCLISVCLLRLCVMGQTGQEQTWNLENLEHVEQTYTGIFTDLWKRFSDACCYYRICLGEG